MAQPSDYGTVLDLPAMREHQSPHVVLVFDRLRKAFNDRDEYAEFNWFAREYPRCYRFHLDGARYRLRTIHSLMCDIHRDLAERARRSSADCFQVATSNEGIERVYWDFESYLSEISIALDLLARIVGPAFAQQTPVSFNKLCKLGDAHPLLDLLRKAKRGWVDRLKDYRDCFTHYTPVDTLLTVDLNRGRNGWTLRAKLPTNPNVREILGFRFNPRVELLRYAIAVHRRVCALDHATARAIWRLYRRRQFPVRKENLFFVGQRSR